jgi:hypothetical protein
MTMITITTIAIFNTTIINVITTITTAAIMIPSST